MRSTIHNGRQVSWMGLCSKLRPQKEKGFLSRQPDKAESTNHGERKLWCDWLKAGVEEGSEASGGYIGEGSQVVTVYPSGWDK